jgi:hypothetical protein
MRMAKNNQPGKTTDEETGPDPEIWAAIRDLDPDRSENESNVACVVTLVALAAVVCVVWLLIHLRGL